MLTIRNARLGSGFRKCDGCRDIHLNAAFSELIKTGCRKGRLRCAMCTAIEARTYRQYVQYESDPQPAGGPTITPPAQPEQEILF